MSESSYRCAHCKGELFIPDVIYHVSYRCHFCQNWNTAELAGNTVDDPIFELRKATNDEAHAAEVLLSRLRAMASLLMKGEQIDLDSLKDEIEPKGDNDEE